MGRMKEVALWLADCVYQRQMSDQAIVESANLVDPNDQHDQFNQWLMEQISIIRRNPQLYDPTNDANASTSGSDSLRSINRIGVRDE